MAYIKTREIIENSKFNRFHILLLIWGSFMIIFDGYDLVVYGSVVPVLMKQWSLTPITAGEMGSYGLIGVMIGAFFFGPLADKIGRKKVILICLTVFSIFTALCGFANSPQTFSIYRFIAGLGLGGIMPNVIALLADYAPKYMRSLLVTIVLCGYSLGGVLAPAFSILFIPLGGWQAVFWISALPLLFIPLLYKQVPESTDFLISKGQTNKLCKVLSSINPQMNFNETDRFERINETVSGSSIVKLFTNQRALSTGMFWIAYFMCLLMVYGLNTWLPNLMIKAGYGLNSSLTFLTILNFGTIIGTLTLSKMADIWGSKKILIPMYIVGTICLTLLGFKSNIFILYLLVAVTGACTIGAQHILNAYVSQYYPTYIRSTALGVASGVGRIGAIIGPTLGGILLMMTWPVQMNFIIFAIPGVFAAIALWFVPEKSVPNKNNEMAGKELDGNQVIES